MKIENMLQRLSCISILFKPPWKFVVEKNYPVNNLMFKIDIKNTRTRCKICLKLTAKTPEFFSLLTLNMYLFAR